MARKRNSPETADQPELAPGRRLPPAPPPPAPAGILEFVADDKRRWRVEKWDDLRAEFPAVTADGLPSFHAWLQQFPRQWLVVRRLFGVMPFVRSLDDDPDDFRPWPRAELTAALGIDADQLAAELESVRAAYKVAAPAEVLLDVSKGLAIEEAPLIESDDDVLRRHGYPTGMFGRDTLETNRLEKAWFAGRIKQFEPLLTRSPMTQSLARQALNKELELRRYEQEAWELDRQRRDLDPGELTTEARRKEIESQRTILRKKIGEVESEYRQQLKAIEQHASWFNVTGEQIDAEQCLADFVKRFQLYDEDPGNRLVDGVYRAVEIQKLMQTSVQIPEPRYRAGWVTYINASRAFLHDPAARSQFRPQDLAKLDAGWKEAVRRMVEETDEKVPDLEKDGDEYQDLFVPEDNLQTPPPVMGVRSNGGAPVANAAEEEWQ